MPIEINGKTITTTPEGFLENASDWSPSVAEKIAYAHGITLTESHWEILRVLRDYCAQGNEPPSMRILANEIRQQLHEEKGRSIYLMTLFGASPAKMASRLAGLPKPKNCF